jgi:hypothetical protein
MENALYSSSNDFSSLKPVFEGVLSVLVMSLETRHRQDGSMMFATLVTLVVKMRHLQTTLTTLVMTTLATLLK